ncbi:MAG: hypothetical protein IJJ95_00115 [Spirochaetales bacterium]|nr:hypothetical protein [Spirochaetales bacterium]
MSRPPSKLSIAEPEPCTEAVLMIRLYSAVNPIGKRHLSEDTLYGRIGYALLPVEPNPCLGSGKQLCVEQVTLVRHGGMISQAWLSVRE